MKSYFLLLRLNLRNLLAGFRGAMAAPCASQTGKSTFPG